MPERDGPGALAGAAEAGIRCHRQHPDITFPDPRLRPIRWLRRQHQIERICRVLRLVAGPLAEGARYHSLAACFHEVLARYAEFGAVVPSGDA